MDMEISCESTANRYMEMTQPGLDVTEAQRSLTSYFMNKGAFGYPISAI